MFIAFFHAETDQTTIRRTFYELPAAKATSGPLLVRYRARTGLATMVPRPAAWLSHATEPATDVLLVAYRRSFEHGVC
jgi:hypothetical protein